MHREKQLEVLSRIMTDLIIRVTLHRDYVEDTR